MIVGKKWKKEIAITAIIYKRDIICHKLNGLTADMK